jgi:Zn finger protein HypA/HybF involved in hydrogenase expression
MHQVVLAQAVLDKAVERARSLGAARIIAVHVLLGEDDEHTEEALRFAWDEVSAGTCAEGAEFVITKGPGDGLRLAAIDIDRTPAPDQRPSAERGEDRLT